ncbi:MAG: hypothetical protein HGA80_01900 [Candidatus Omnitrophica bacterium]|nr:hypothetical protein [Candidatus Omnitrophota bacterium]
MVLLAALWGLGRYEVACAEDVFREVQGDHFIVKYLLADERENALRILQRAEDYYKRVADGIGYSRYQEYWTWERRVNIVLYPDQMSYARFTGQPVWSKGYASRDSRLFHSKVVVSYDDQPDFLEEILPHEITHLMVWDFLGFTRKVPIWFEEGLAQLEEQGKRDVVQEAMQGVVAAGNAIPFTTFNSLNITSIQDQTRVSLFYAQSLSIVDFMLTRYGKDAFRHFCRELRQGGEFEESLARAYPAIFRTLFDLEWKWKNYLQNDFIPGGSK